MNSYKLEIKKAVQKFLDKHPDIKPKILAILKVIAENPETNVRLFDIKPIVGKNNHYRLRVNKYRLLFKKKDNELIIIALEADRRGDIYKGL